jgi:hypothetical protein
VISVRGLRGSKVGRGREDARRRGHTLLELMLVASVLLFALLLFSQTMGSAVNLGDVNHDSRIAMDAAGEIIETLDGVETFSEVFALYNDDPDDDPVAGAPGSNFAVAGLDPADDDPDGTVGEIVFPTEYVLGQTVLRESLVEPLLGMPRDLNGDGDLLDDLTNDYRLLPVLVRLRWKSRTGVRVMEVQTLLADR